MHDVFSFSFYQIVLKPNCEFNISVVSIFLLRGDFKNMWLQLFTELNWFIYNIYVHIIYIQESKPPLYVRYFVSLSW